MDRRSCGAHPSLITRMLLPHSLTHFVHTGTNQTRDTTSLDLVLSGGSTLSSEGFHVFSMKSHQSNADIDVCNVRYSLRARYGFITPQSNTHTPNPQPHPSHSPPSWSYYSPLLWLTGDTTVRHIYTMQTWQDPVSRCSSVWVWTNPLWSTGWESGKTTFVLHKIRFILLQLNEKVSLDAWWESDEE